MSKNAKAKTKSVQGTARVHRSATTSKKNTQPIPPTYPLNENGCRLLAQKVIQSAFGRKIDESFLESKWYDFWSGIAYNIKPDYVNGQEAIELYKVNSATAKKVGHPRL